MRYFSSAVAILAITLSCHSALADGKKAAEGRRAGTAKADKPGAAGRPANRAADGARRRPEGGNRPADVREMATRLMQGFDRNGDRKLDLRELAAALQAMRQARQGGGRPGDQQPRAAAQRGPGGRAGAKGAGGGAGGKPGAGAARRGGAGPGRAEARPRRPAGD